ncbi:MAG: hypothetical protein MR635_04980 [Mollicutes bacterium]|nr:hypothetical protein [Mollicutes bacterium]
METKLDKLIFNYPKVPSRKFKLVAVPMYMYTVQTNNFKNGMDFFEKAVLRFKTKPGFKDEDIARLLGVDEKLVKMIESKLVLDKQLDGNGVLTEKGKTTRMQMDGLIVDESHKKIGYVFQYINEDRFYPFYVDNYRIPDSTAEAEPRILGQKGDGYMTKVCYAKEILDEAINLPAPDEKTISRLIKNVSQYGRQDVMDTDSKGGETNLSVKLLPDDTPQLVWVCTYMYYKQESENLFSSDWKVMDPFVQRDSENEHEDIAIDDKSLKMYLNDCAPKLVEEFENEFGDVETVEKQKYREASTSMDKVVEECFLEDFGIFSSSVDNQLLKYIRRIIRSRLRYQYDDDIEDASINFSDNLQKVFEGILQKHRLKYPREYKNASYDFDGSKDHKGNTEKKQETLNTLYRFLLKKEAPVQLLAAAKQSIWRPTALKGLIVAFYLTRMYKDPLYSLILTHSDILLEISELRNDRSHGKTQEQSGREYLTREEVDKYYDFLKRFILDYTNI